MNIGIMGGTFDPLHIGHMLAAEAARDSYGLDEVWFMPSYIPPHKQQAGLTGEERLELVQAAVADCGHFRILDWEVRRGGVSYTVETARRLKETYPDHRFHFIVGADMVEYLPKWREIGELTQLLTFIGVARPGTELNLGALPSGIADKVAIAEMPLIGISSTLIRERAAGGQSIRYMVPEPVYELIRRRGYYGIQP